MQSASSSLKTKAIRAGAGAGKTYNLTREVIGQALAFQKEKQRWPRFVVTTFTKKATQELSERLMALALDEFPQAMEFVSSAQFLKVSTIHGVLDDFLKDQGHVIGLKSDFSYLKEGEAIFLSKKTLKTIVDEGVAPIQSLFMYFSFSQLHDFLRLSSQRDLHGYRPLSLAQSLELLQNKLQAAQLQVQNVLSSIPKYQLPPKWKSMEVDLLRIKGFLSLKAWEKAEDAIALIDGLDLRSGLKLKSHPDSALIYEDLKEAIESLRDLTHPSCQIATLQTLAACNADFEVLRKEYMQRLIQAKIAQSRIEMSDLEILSLLVLRKDSRSAILWGHKKDYWFIDEFQDTSPQQLTLLKALIQNRSYYLVGDPQQSIYLFRGARSEVFAEQFQIVESSGGELHFLNKNYRSTPQILSLINRAAFYLGESFAEMETAKELSSSVEDVVVFSAPETEQKNDFASELRFLEQSIFDLQAQGVTLDQVAILVRRNKDLELVGQFLSQKKIPVHLHSSGLFWQRREVQAALCLLRFLIQPQDNENLVRLLRVPLMTVSDQNLVDLMALPGDALWAKMKDDCEKGIYGRSGRILFDVRKSQHELGLVVAFEKALHELGFFDFHWHLDPTGRAEGNLWKFVGLVKNFERERGAAFVQFVNDCEKAIDNESSVDSPGSVEKNKVNVMTVHASKGLQFDYLFLPFLAQKPYREHHAVFSIDESVKTWSVRAPASETETQSTSSLFEKKVLEQFHSRQDEEDWRVLYVALTRAIQKLYLSWTAPVHEKSWAQVLSFLFHAEEQKKFQFRLKIFDPDKDFKELALSKTELSSPTVRKRFQNTTADERIVRSQAVTKLVAKNQKSYRAAFIKKQQGILFHKLVEVIKYPVQKDIPALLQSWFGEQQEDVLGALNYVLTLQEPPLVEIMKSGHVEWAFRLIKDGQPIDGQVDLWAIYEETLWIVDYKSGEKILLDKSFAQLALYAEAIQEHLKWQGPIKTAVLYPFLQTSFVRSL